MDQSRVRTHAGDGRAFTHTPIVFALSLQPLVEARQSIETRHVGLKSN